MKIVAIKTTAELWSVPEQHRLNEPVLSESVIQFALFVS